MPSSVNPKKIVLKGDPISKEGQVGTGMTLVPGVLVQFDNDGDVAVHSTAGGNATNSFCDVRDYMGETISSQYSAGESIKYNVHRSGDEVYAFLSAGQDVNKGDFLESAGNGALREFTNQANQFNSIVAIALEDVDNSLGGAKTRIKVEIV